MGLRPIFRLVFSYNNDPQQIGVASSESGHPGVFVDADGTPHLFYQGNNDGGKTTVMEKNWSATSGPQSFSQTTGNCGAGWCRAALQWSHE